MKKILSLLLCLVLCFSFSIAVSAEVLSTDAIQPYYDQAYTAKSELYINGSPATCTSISYGYSDVTKIIAVQTLEKQGFLWIWGTYDSTKWTKTVYSNNLTMSNTKSGLASGKYRLKTVYTLTNK